MTQEQVNRDGGTGRCPRLRTTLSSPQKPGYGNKAAAGASVPCYAGYPGPYDDAARKTWTAMTPQVALIPDSVYGALLLSVIDFFLSFLAISVIGFVLAIFPYLNRTALQAPPVSVSVMPARDESAELVAAIAASIYTMLDERRIVHIGEARPAPGWTLEYRALMHTSHAPRATHNLRQQP